MGKVVQTLYKSLNSRRKMPVNIKTKDFHLFSHESERFIPESKLYLLKWICLDSKFQLHTSKKHILAPLKLSTTVIHYSFKSVLSLILKHSFKRNYEIQLDPVCLVSDSWSNGYFHWLNDVLPRVLAIRHFCIQYGVVLPEHYKNLSYITSSLNYLGINKIKFLSGDKLYFFKIVYFPTLVAPTGNFNDPITRLLRQAFHKPILSLIAPKRRVYLSRNLAQRRRVVNEKDILVKLKELDFEVVYTEELSFYDQVVLFYNTEILISSHGAGLSNLLFMQENSKVLELRAENDSLNNCYFSLASALMLTYYYQICSKENIDDNPHTANIIVDVQELEKNIMLLLSN
jgi:hypothetical protein